MVLFNDIIQVFTLTDFALFLIVSIILFQARLMGSALINILQTRFTILANRFFQNTKSGFGITWGCQEKINRLPLLFDCSIIICPLAFELNVISIPSPPNSRALLLSPEGGFQLW